MSITARDSPSPSCDVCLQPVDSAVEKIVTCSRIVCGKSFHPFCVDLNLSVWSTLACDVGLRWFCAGCREEEARRSEQVIMKDVLVRIERLEVEVRTGFAKCLEVMPVGKVPVKVEKKGLEAVPARIWSRIFENLNGHQLGQARLTCRRWNRVIGRSSLVDKLVLSLPRETILHGGSEEVKMLSSTSYTKVKLEDLTILKPAIWWSSISKNLHTLAIRDILLSDLVVIFEQTPKLKSLSIKYHNSDIIEIPEANFQLCLLEELCIDSSSDKFILPMFNEKCPKLKTLTISCDEDENSILAVQFIKSVRKTLENLSVLSGSILFWDTLLKEGRHIRLIRLMCDIHYYEQLNELAKAQPCLEELILANCVDPSDVNQLIQTLPNLRSLEVIVNNNPALNFNGMFLESIHQLQTLKLMNFWSSPHSNGLNGLNGKVFTNMKSIELSGFYPDVKWATVFPNLRSINLKQIKLENWNDFFQNCALLKNLHSLELSRVEAETEIYRNNFTQNLIFLKLSNCKMSACFLQTMLARCSNLQEVRFEDMESVNDAVINIICQTASRLKTLTVESCKIRDASIQHIIRHCAVIERVELVNCCDINQSSLQSLRKHNSAQVIVKSI